MICTLPLTSQSQCHISNYSHSSYWGLYQLVCSIKAWLVYSLLVLANQPMILKLLHVLVTFDDSVMAWSVCLLSKPASWRHSTATLLRASLSSANLSWLSLMHVMSLLWCCCLFFVDSLVYASPCRFGNGRYPQTCAIRTHIFSLLSTWAWSARLCSQSRSLSSLSITAQTCLSFWSINRFIC